MQTEISEPLKEGNSKGGLNSPPTTPRPPAPPGQRPKHDPVHSPKYYADFKIQAVDAIECWGLGFHLGNAIKYIVRAGKKDKTKEIEDLQKAIWYINRKIANLQSK